MRYREGQAGLAMVEFAIVLPLMMLLILGVTELGRAFMQYNTLTKAVRDGARHLAAYSLYAGAVRIDAQRAAEARNLVVYGNSAGNGSPVLQNLSPAQVTVSDVGGGQVRIDVSYPYQPLTGPTLPNFGLGSSTPLAFTMQASVTMRAL